MRTIYTCFLGGKHKALTMSCDDGEIGTPKAADILNPETIAFREWADGEERQRIMEK